MCWEAVGPVCRAGRTWALKKPPIARLKSHRRAQLVSSKKSSPTPATYTHLVGSQLPLVELPCELVGHREDWGATGAARRAGLNN